jgi:Copper binding periplasmic protein CusF
MKLAKWILAGSMLMAVPAATLAQQPLTGTVITIDRISGTIGIEKTQTGTVGAGSGGAIQQEYKAAEGLLENVHAGDRVTFSVADNDGKKTITKIESK